MDLAREGLPQSHGVGYEIFDKPNIAMSDFVQKLNARRALEGELERTIMALTEVDKARVHIVDPKPSVFLEEEKQTKASVVLKPRIGKQLAPEQVQGITFLVSSSVEGLETKNISIVSASGELLSSAYKEDETALISSRNLQLQRKVENYLERKAGGLLEGVLGSENARIRVVADLDFDEVNRTLEKYDPEGKVVRSEEISSKETTNAPTGDHEEEHSITNYEINKTMEHVVKEVGNINRLSVSVVVDGRYEKTQGGEKEYAPRSPEEMQKLSDMVKNAVGYSLERGDDFNITNIKFDRMHFEEQRVALARQQRQEFIMMLVKYGLILILGIMVLLLVRYVANTMKEAMNPPVPEVPQLQREEEVEEVPEEMQRSSELLEKVEMMSRESPTNVSAIISNWLKEGYAQKT
jgi:flagellar M-ring protein FliF